MSSKVKTGIIVGSIALVFFGLYALSRKLVDNSYSSYEYVRQQEEIQVQESSTLGDGLSEENAEKAKNAYEGLFAEAETSADGKIIDDQDYNYPVENSSVVVPVDNGIHEYMGIMLPSKEQGGYFIPKAIYNSKDLESRVAGYIDETLYESIFKEIEANIAEYELGINIGIYYDDVMSVLYQDIPEDDNTNPCVSTGLVGDLDKATVLSEYKGMYAYNAFIGTSTYLNESGMEAIYFFNNHYVIYRVSLADEDILVVVDYSKSVFNAEQIGSTSGYPLVDMGCIARKDVYVPYFNSNIVNIQGMTVIFTSDINESYTDGEPVTVRYSDLVGEVESNEEFEE